MKKTILATTLAAAFALPALASEWPADEKGERPSFTFEFDMHELLAQAEETKARAHADADRARAEARSGSEHMSEWSRSYGADLAQSMAYMFGDRAGRGRVVKGHPYSADIVTETHQTLPDGNVISHRNVNKVWRDGEGRTRQETYRGEKIRSIHISDPVGGVTYTLIPGSKIAVSVPRPDLTHVHVAPRPRVDRPGRMSTETSTETRDGQKRVTVRTIESDGSPGVREEVRVQVVRVGDDASVMIAPLPPTPPVPAVPPVAAVPPVPPIPPGIPGVHTMRFESTSHLGKGETKGLGTKEFDGVKAEGRQTTWTIPAGKIGNRNPIAVTSESWYSPELQVTVYSRHSDPRTGESLYRLASVKRAEPQADLFKVPDDYEVKGKGRKKEKDK